MASTSSKKLLVTPKRVEPVSQALGVKLKELRKRANISQAELSFDCSLDRTYISLIERGLANPSLWTLATIAGALQVTLPDLLAGNSHTVAVAHADGTRRRKNQASHEVRPEGTRRSALR